MALGSHRVLARSAALGGGQGLKLRGWWRGDAEDALFFGSGEHARALEARRTLFHGVADEVAATLGTLLEVDVQHLSPPRSLPREPGLAGSVPARYEVYAVPPLAGFPANEAPRPRRDLPSSLHHAMEGSDAATARRPLLGAPLRDGYPPDVWLCLAARQLRPRSSAARVGAGAPHAGSVDFANRATHFEGVTAGSTRGRCRLAVFGLGRGGARRGDRLSARLYCGP